MPSNVPKIIVGLGSCGLAAGAKDVLTAIEAELAAGDIKAEVGPCAGASCSENAKAGGQAGWGGGPARG